jgi:hypothetical protein
MDSKHIFTSAPDERIKTPTSVAQIVDSIWQSFYISYNLGQTNTFSLDPEIRNSAVLVRKVQKPSLCASDGFRRSPLRNSNRKELIFLDTAFRAPLAQMERSRSRALRHRQAEDPRLTINLSCFSLRFGSTLLGGSIF